LRDNKKILQYFKKYQQTETFSTRPEGPIYLAELLIDLGGEKKQG